jgi:4-amino-4-deoxy-L-arabinose transferase-like glycosyltransferase
MRSSPPVTGVENKDLFTRPVRPSYTQRHWWLFVLALGVLAFGIRFYYIVHAVVFQPVYVANFHGDNAQYYHYALNLVQHSVFSQNPPENGAPIPDNFRDPGYPIFLAGLLLIFKSWSTWYTATLICQALLSALTVVLWINVGRDWMPMPWLVAAGILMAWWPHSVTMSSFILSETLFGFLCALSIWLFCIATNRNKPGWIAASGVGFSLAALTNAVLLPFAALLAVYVWMQRNMTTRATFIFVAVTLGTLAPWSIRNATLPADHLSSTSRAWMNLVQGSWPEYHDSYMAWARSGDTEISGVLTEINHEIDGMNAHPVTGAMVILHRLASSPGKYMGWYLKKPVLLWEWSIRIGQGGIYVYGTRNSPYEFSPIWRAISAVCYAFNPLLLLLTSVGCVLGLRRTGPPIAMTATALLLVFITLIYSILQAEPRYSIPYRGPEILLGLFAAYWLSGKLTQLRDRYRHVNPT